MLSFERDEQGERSVPSFRLDGGISPEKVGNWVDVWHYILTNLGKKGVKNVLAHPRELSGGQDDVDFQPRFCQERM